MVYKVSALLITCILFMSSCSGSGSPSAERPGTVRSTTQVVLVGSTPGDELIKSILSIPIDRTVDFIRWNLVLNNRDSNQNTYSLDIVYGESQPNTLGYKGGGEKLSFEGVFTISKKGAENINGPIFHLESSKLPSKLKMV